MTAEERAMLRASFQLRTITPTYRHAGNGVATRTPHGFLQRRYSNRWGMEMAVRASVHYPAIIEWEGEFNS